MSRIANKRDQSPASSNAKNDPTKHQQDTDVLKKQIADIDATIKTMIDNNPDLSEKDKIIQSVPGIGQGTSQVLLSALPELGEGNWRHWLD